MASSRWIHRALAIFGIAALTLAMTSSVVASSPPSHAGRVLHASLTGAAEVPPADPDGSGTALIWVNYGQRRVCWQLNVTNITLPATAAHIHLGAVGVNGDVVVPLSPPDATGASSGCVKVLRSLAKNLIQHPGRYYVNVHTTDFPGGAIRGQLSKGSGHIAQPPVTALKIVKVVDGNTFGWAGGTFGFTVNCGAAGSFSRSITLASGETQGSTKLTDIAVGTVCTVAETSNTGAGANASWSGTAYSPLGGVATITAGSTVTVTVTNTRAVTPGSLQITKSITGNLTGWVGGTFNFTVTCGAAVIPTSIALTGGATTGVATISGLTAGASCTVAEVAPFPDPVAPHTWGAATYAPSATAIIPAASTVVVTVTDPRT